MRITELNVYRADLPLKDTDAYRWSEGKSVCVFDTTVVEVVTDSGIVGYGESCPLGPNYLPSYAAGVRAGLRELRPHLLGQDPLWVDSVNASMDYQLKGHPYVKSAVDMALWDILGKFSGLPVYALLGGAYGDSVPLYRPISRASPAEMAAEAARCKRQMGYSRFQLKVGDGRVADDAARIRAVREALDPDDVLVADANTGWSVHAGIRVCQSVRDLDVYIEQPCGTAAECERVRSGSACGLPFIADECVDSVESLLAVRSFADCANLKISKLGGITKARRMRDLCCELGLAMVIEDTWGSDFVTAAIAHLAMSTQPKWRLMSADFNAWHAVNVGHVEGGELADGKGGMRPPEAKGLGVRPNFQVLEPVL